MSYKKPQASKSSNTPHSVTFESPVYTPQSSSRSPSTNPAVGKRRALPTKDGAFERSSSTAGEPAGDWDSDSDEMGDHRPPLHRPTDGRSAQPLLHSEEEQRGRTGYNESGEPTMRPTFSRRSTMRSRSPDTQAKLAAKKKYTYAAFFLVLSLISFTVQTETAVYIQHELKWNKAYCML
jgi:hypothetical protein